MIVKPSEVLTIQEALDNLAAISFINMEAPPPLGIAKKTRIVTDKEEFGPGIVQWLSEEGIESVVTLLDTTYRTVHNYLFNLYDSPEMDWSGPRCQKGITSMMVLVGESAPKMDAYLTYRLGKKLPLKIEDRDEYKALQIFYRERFSKKFPEGVTGAEVWQKEWQENEASTLLDITGSGLKDFETVKQDQEYELFYIRNEEGKPYFDPELIRNIKVSVDFDIDTESFEEDPLLQVRTMADRDLHATASQILGECHPIILDFYKVARKKVEENDLAEALNMAVVALFLAANPRHLIQNTSGKSALQYFEDFHRFLRRCMKTTEYQKYIAYPPEKSNKLAHLLLHLTHSICRAFFTRVGGVRQEAIGLIHRTMRRGEELQSKKIKGEQLWTQFLIEDEKLRTLLSQFPNGPLFKILDLIREEDQEDTIVPFDPTFQGNLPLCLYEIAYQGKRIPVLRLPSPTKQSLINKAEINDEFRGFLRSLAEEKNGQKHLIIQFQDRISWREQARSKAIENLQKNPEFNSYVLVMTLSKDTDFYHQNTQYLSLNNANDFIDVLKKQVANPESSGFYFPSIWKQKEINQFTAVACQFIHECFFEGKETLTRHQRQDFIELFYQFLILRAIDQFRPTSMSLSCKDAVDTAAAVSAQLFALISLLNKGFRDKKEHDTFRWLMYMPALFIRERAIDFDRLQRVLSPLERFDKEFQSQGGKFPKAFEGEFSRNFFRDLKVH